MRGEWRSCGKLHDEKLLAYLLGFGCHYLLDSACHPYIEDMAAKEVITHTLLEKEFDRTLMLEHIRIHIIITRHAVCSQGSPMPE